MFKEDWGNFKGIKVKLILELDVILMFVKVRYVLYVLKLFKVEIEFDKLVKDGVLEKCDFSEWVILIVLYCSLLMC